MFESYTGSSQDTRRKCITNYQMRIDTMGMDEMVEKSNIGRRCQELAYGNKLFRGGHSGKEEDENGMVPTYPYT